MKRAPWLLLLALACCSEEPPHTQIMVVVDADYDGFSRVEIEVDGFEEDLEAVAIGDLARRPLPRRLALLHNGGPLGPIDVTVRAWVAGVDGPVRVEPRRGLSFVRGKTRMLKVDLLWDCIRQQCAEACQAGQCVSVEKASKLREWDSNFDPLEVDHKIELGDVLTKVDGGDVVPVGPEGGADEDARVPGAGSGGSVSGTGGSAVEDAGKDSGFTIDAGPVEAEPVYRYTPTNFDPDAISTPADERPAVMLDCPVAEFDSTTLSFDTWCGDEPVASVIQQDGGGEAALLVMSTLTIDSGTVLRLVGERPVILAVFGDAQISGEIDAGAHGEQPGPGGGRECADDSGSTGGSGETDGSVGAGGGSGGGFGTMGARGGAGGGVSVQADGGGTRGVESLSPLRGGCSGGHGGAGTKAGGAGGGGGGGLQISAAGDLILFGRIGAGGGGGMMGSEAGDGGGGGGSGGAILIEAAQLLVDSNATIAANGGGGGGGQPTLYADFESTAGADATAESSAAVGGDGANSGGSGGNGGHVGGSAADGEDGAIAIEMAGGGGGGGGGAGRIRINQATSCTPRGVFSPTPSVDCPKCGVACPTMPASNCVPHSRGNALYYVCPGPLTHQGAIERCQSAGATLVRVNDAAENDWLNQQLGGTTAWIGASDVGVEGDWEWIGDVLFWRGSSVGQPVGGLFNDWADGEPNQSGDCGRSEADGWHDQICALTSAYVCER